MDPRKSLHPELIPQQRSVTFMGRRINGLHSTMESLMRSLGVRGYLRTETLHCELKGCPYVLPADALFAGGFIEVDGKPDLKDSQVHWRCTKHFTLYYMAINDGIEGRRRKLIKHSPLAGPLEHHDHETYPLDFHEVSLLATAAPCSVATLDCPKFLLRHAMEGGFLSEVDRRTGRRLARWVCGDHIAQERSEAAA